MLLKAKGITIKDFAKQCHISRERFHLYLKGGAYPHMDNIIRIANNLGYRVRFVMEAQECPERETDQELFDGVNATAEEANRNRVLTVPKRKKDRTKIGIEENSGRGVFPLYASHEEIGALALDLPIDQDSVKTALRQLLNKLEK